MKREEAEVAIQMLQILDAKPEGWREQVRRLGNELKRLKRLEPPIIDLTKLEGAVNRKQQDKGYKTGKSR